MAEPFFREIEHTADLGIEVEAETTADLFRCAGLALFSFMVNLENVQPHEERFVTVQAEDWEELFHDWLSHLLREFLQNGFIAVNIKIENIDPTRLSARVTGEKLDYNRHEFETEIKAVTYHQLAVTQENDHWRAHVIFDV
ncbi:MAG: archease [Candidatus Binatia bacterium]